MNIADRPKFVEIVLGFAELKGKQLSAPVLELYWRAMQSWTIQDFSSAAEHLLRTSEFFPTPDKFEALRKAARPTAGEAWTRAVAACGSAIQCGQVTNNGSCGDALIDRVVRAIGGYGAIAMTDTEKLHFLERRFVEHFETMQDAEDTREALPELTQEFHRRPLSGPQSIQALLAHADSDAWEPS